MSGQVSLWLYPLVLMSSFALIMYARMGLTWTWGFCLQSLVILGTALLGFAISPLAWECAVAGWALFFLTIVVPRRILFRLEKNLMLLSPVAAARDARLLRFFFWGQPGRFWSDMTLAMSSFMQGDAEGGEKIIFAWRERKIPRATREGLESYLFTGRILRRDWTAIIDEFNRLSQEKGTRLDALATSAARAYLELGLVRQALHCLEIADIPSKRFSRQNLDMLFLPFFSLSGFHDEMNAVIADAQEAGAVLPACAILYWKGRCLAAKGQVEEGRSKLREALAAAPQSASYWAERIQYQLDRLAGKDALMPASDWSAECSRASEVLARAHLVSDIVAPDKPRPGVVSLVVMIVAAYVVSHSFSIFPSPVTIEVSRYCLQYGVLDSGAVLFGEYWRLITYLFLHSHLTHLALNLFGLWWFGRLSENLFGTARFLSIYFLSGILSGVTHVVLSPDLPAVGASGAVMGVFGAAAAGIFRKKGILPDNIRKSEVNWMLGLAATQVVLDQFVPQVAVFAHLGGFVAGLALGLIMPMPLTEPAFLPGEKPLAERAEPPPA